MKFEDLSPGAQRVVREMYPDLAKPKRKVRTADKDSQRFERELDFQLRAAKVPPFERQHRFVPGRRLSADFAWPQLRLIVELQGGIWRKGGGAHSHPLNLIRDLERLQLAVMHGWYVFPVLTDDVKPGRALRLVEAAIRARTVHGVSSGHVEAGRLR